MNPIDVVIKSLEIAYGAVLEKGDAGKKTVSTAIDISTEADKIAGMAVIEYLKAIKFIGVVYTEEEGEVQLSKGGRYSVVMDDLDGTKNFKEGFGMLPYGCILGVFEGINPRFSDCVASGYLDFPSGNLFFAEKDKGAYLIRKYASGGRIKERIKTSGRKTLTGGESPTILIDIYELGSMAPHFAKYSERAWLGDLRASAAHVALIASGSADLFIQGDNAFNPNKRKTAEEIGPGFLLIKEAGGSILMWSGRRIDGEFVGLGKKKTWHLIYAATEELAREFIKDMRAIPEVNEYIRKKKLD